MWIAFLFLLLLVWKVRFLRGRFFFGATAALGVRQARNKLKRENSILRRN